MRSPKDLVLHSATQLFQEGECHNGLHDLLPMHTSCNTPLVDQARWMLYVRSHLLRKAWMQRFLADTRRGNAPIKDH